MARLPRRKVNMTYIANNAVRKATFRRRKKGLTKKIGELTTLCGVDACAVIFSPDGNQSEVWPSAEGFQGVLSRFQNLSEFERGRNKMDHKEFLRERIEKASNQKQKRQRTNREREIANLMSESLKAGGIYQNLNLLDLGDLRLLVEQNLKQVDKALLDNNADHPPSQ
ncbi:agamous-like MADS-box protein AGL80 [Tripterygium wilfordii]|uniref:Agamous-like MADS-box protein AGL80 n=1 Tax=Tripterygium wilfordii TaxID=458696 RepID=A0A7J7CLU4_TRIWF|nr:agamous-like MADS-box protein AGL80 [Tripterygium wilfordii]KAF5735030.1 agamous-like MADS-box protein AGL80 [Tripterygium wilfordii]